MSAKAPRLSVVIATYNRAEWLSTAIQSVLNQIGDRDDVEIVISDDASTDGTADVIKEFTSNPLVTTLYNDTNLGFQENVLAAATAASGSMILLLGDDDLFLPGTIAVYTEAVVNYPSVAAILCNGVQISHDATKITYCFRHFKNDKLLNGLDAYKQLWTNATFITGLAIQRDIIIEHWRSDLIYPQLYAIAIALQDASVLGLKHFGFAARIHPGQLGNHVLGSQESKNEKHVFAELPQILEEVAQLSEEEIITICTPFLMNAYKIFVANRRLEHGRLRAYETLRLALRTYPPLRRPARLSQLTVIIMLPKLLLLALKESQRWLHLRGERLVLSDTIKSIRSVASPTYPLQICPICEHNLDTNNIDHITDYLYGTQGIFSISLCSTCRIAFTVPAPRDLASHYPARYGAHQPSRPSAIRSTLYGWAARSSRSFSWMRFLSSIARQIVTLAPSFEGSRSLIDVGCGNGRTLLDLKNAGWQTTGIELDNAAAARARSLGLDVLVGDFTTVEMPESYDVVRMNHVLEHTNRPDLWLAQAFRILRNDGRLYIGVPNREGLSVRLFGRYALPWDVPRHLCHFDAESLRILVEKTGFVVETIRFNSLHSDYVPKSLAHAILHSRFSDKKALRALAGRLLQMNIYRTPFPVLSKLQDWSRQGDNLELVAKKL